MSARKLWNVGSEILVYSTSKNHWYNGEIIDVINDTEGEWLQVKYNYGKSIKEIKRFSNSLKSRKHTTAAVNLRSVKIGNNFKKIYKLNKRIGRGGEGSIWSIKNHDDIVTKLYDFERSKKTIRTNPNERIKSNEKIRKITEEYLVFSSLKLVDIKNISFASFKRIKRAENGTLHICVTMEKLAYNLYDYSIKNVIKNIKLKHLILQIAGCLHKIHSMGYGHFDISPENIMYNNNNNNNIYYGNGWKVIDGGHLTKINNDIGYSQANSLNGKAGYWSPEMQCKQKYKISKKSDIWSFGVTILFVLGIRTKIYDVKNGIYVDTSIFCPTTQEIVTNDLNDMNKVFQYFHKIIHKMNITKLLLVYYNKIEHFDKGLFCLLIKMLQIDPVNRPSTLEIINNKYFDDVITKKPDGIYVEHKLLVDIKDM